MTMRWFETKTDQENRLYVLLENHEGIMLLKKLSISEYMQQYTERRKELYFQKRQGYWLPLEIFSNVQKAEAYMQHMYPNVLACEVFPSEEIDSSAFAKCNFISLRYGAVIER